MVSQPQSASAGGGDVFGFAERENTDAAVELVRGMKTVRRVSYNSPLEIWLYIQAAEAVTGSALAAAYGGVRLFERIQKARVSKARSDLEVGAYRVLQLELGLPTTNMDLEGTQPQFHNESIYLERRRQVNAAINVLGILQSVEVVDEREIESR